MKTTSILIALVLLCKIATAQVSMMGDVSLPYLDKLIETAKANYPKFGYTKAKENASKAAYDKTKCGVFDFLTLSYVYMPGNFGVYDNNTYRTSLNGYQVGVFMNVGSVLQKPATIRQAKHEFIAAKMDKQVVDMELVQEVRKRYFIYLQQSNIVKLKSKSLDDADDILKHVKYKFEKGEITFDAYNQALLNFSTYSQDKIIAESSLLIARSSLEEIVGTSLENIK